jgi:hypothetical protein
MRLTLPLALAGFVLAAAPLAAQGRGRASDSVPAAYVPPPGMCRIWLQNVPPAKQAAPTDCATAVRNRPANGRVVFGDSSPRRGKAPAVPVKNALPIQPTPPPATKAPVPPLPKVPPPPGERGRGKERSKKH